MKKLLSLLLVLLFNSAIAQKSTTLDSLLHSYYQDGKPGVAMAVVKEGKTVYHQEIGMANLEYGIPISDSTSFHLASVSKQFTAYLALKLEQEGKLKMEDDVRSYLPELKGLPYKISLTNLANHTHGLPNISELVNIRGFGSADRLWHRNVVDMALQIETFNFKPGENYQYGNTGFLLLAEVIERVSQMPFHEALQKYIFEPLEMSSSFAVYSPDMIVKNRAESYVLTNDGFLRYDNNIMTNGSSGIRMTMKDMAKWTSHFQTSIGDSTSPFAKMIKPSKLNDGKELPYGLGLETKDYKGLKTVFHGGGDAGYRAYTLHIPEHKISVFLLGNTNDYWLLEIGYKVVDLYLSEFQEEEAPEAGIKYTTEDLKAFEGIYTSFPGSYQVFTAENDSLYLSFLGESGRFAVPVLGKNTFGYPFYPKSKYIFSEGGAEHYIADFVYKHVNTKPELKTYSKDELEEFTGFYYNKSLNTSYQIVVVNEQLVARHPINYDIALNGLANDSFFSQHSFFSKLDFVRNKSRETTSFKLSGQNFLGLEFVKL